MPVKKLVRIPATPQAASLRQRLLDEWHNPASTAAQPVILEEPGGANQPLHVYVIWDDWAHLDMVERSEIIIDAFEQKYGSGSAANVTVAMGLTPTEADRLGISYQ
jgi:hypothetical protein